MINSVYIAKSNKCNPSHYMIAKGIISSNPNITIHEWIGVNNPGDLVGSDLLIVIPDAVNAFGVVGKGLFAQINTFAATGKNAYVLSGIKEGTNVVNNLPEVNIKKLHGCSVLPPSKQDGFIVFGTFSYDNNELNLSEVVLDKEIPNGNDTEDLWFFD